MKKWIPVIMVLLLAACGQSYEETKRISRQQRLEAQRLDSMALKIAVMPTLDCLPLYVAQHYALFDTIFGGVRLRQYTAQMDCDTALQRGRVEGSITDLVRAQRMEQQGCKLRYMAVTNAYWQLFSNRNARIRQLKQLENKMVAMTRYSATDLLTSRVADSVKLQPEKVFRIQVNDVHVRVQMLQNNEIDALWLTEPQATAARMMKHPIVSDSRALGLQLGLLAFREKEMQRQTRGKQFNLFLKAYNQACDSINKYGLSHYRSLIVKQCGLRQEWVDSLPRDIQYIHAHGPRMADVDAVKKWLGEK